MRLTEEQMRRKAFEKWAKNEGMGGLARIPAWAAWQAAYQLGLSTMGKQAAEAAYDYIRDWRICDCEYESEGKLSDKRYNTECGHAIECDYYLADAVYKQIRAAAFTRKARVSR